MSPARPIARRMAHIQPFHVMDLLARARRLEAQGRDIVHLEIGEPDFQTPAPIVEAGIRALQAGYTHYTPATGLPALREAIARYYQDVLGANVAPERIVITPGASGALLLVMGILLNPDDQVVMTDPGYPCNRHFVRTFEGEAVSVPVGPETDYQLTAAHLARHWSERTVAAMVATPSNPTGTLADSALLSELLDFTRGRGGTLIVDEIYQGLVYEGETGTAAALSEDLFVINSFSKFFGMTGWRLGWVVAPRDCVRELDKLAQNLFLAASTPAQHAALAAFTPACMEILEARREAFRARRDFLLPALRELGLKVPVTPRGAFYIYGDSTAFGEDSFVLAERCLEETGVAITPGLDFGTHLARSHVRFAYTRDLPVLEQAVERLRAFLRS
ncbi:pyridoxal phosphate-dependent aminotransferase [Ectothiorhodospira lacustris]|uniref:pyridoxal phosphate-dependent aminotransferase n=1 Tax=Ectothiorhodospira lacustris TaxID=2899127 RepID=UPI001EE8264A|nr:pyridoxal phosphate-dependent aminotransferase [Ectothiorhodospira lacustris]MCG5511043.1 pyridoxal phosphate-dependent aminotransferase [Ectothiorhodospira lacustris]MCG5522773.1 pyridoxal phosphate-dependent aminotransferase [Ectothiorhodospira lacustris]